MIYYFQIPYQTDIGEGFYIGHFGSIIINSKVKLGKNVLIAPNSYVNFNVPDNFIVIGNPAKVIHDT